MMVSLPLRLHRVTVVITFRYVCHVCGDSLHPAIVCTDEKPHIANRCIFIANRI
jgi:hypothetical protein